MNKSIRRFTGLFQHDNYAAWLVYGLTILLVLILQMAPRFFPTVVGARPVPLVLLVVCTAIFEGARTGATVGVLAGLLWDMYSQRLFGFDALILLVVGVVAGLLVEWLLRTNLLSALLLCSGAVLFQALMEWFCIYVVFGSDQLWSALLRIYLPNTLYTVVLTPLMYWFVLKEARFLRRRQKNRD